MADSFGSSGVGIFFRVFFFFLKNKAAVILHFLLLSRKSMNVANKRLVYFFNFYQIFSYFQRQVSEEKEKTETRASDVIVWEYF